MFLISLIWSAITVLLALNEVNANAKVLMVFLERFFFIAAITIPFDIRDIERDSSEEIRTIPVLLGTAGSKKVAYVFITGFYICVIASLHTEAQSFSQATALFISGIISTILIAKAEVNRSRLYYVFGVEGMSLLQSLLVALTLII